MWESLWASGPISPRNCKTEEGETRRKPQFLGLDVEFTCKGPLTCQVLWFLRGVQGALTCARSKARRSLGASGRLSFSAEGRKPLVFKELRKRPVCSNHLSHQT